MAILWKQERKVFKDIFGLKTQNCLMGRNSGFKVDHTQIWIQTLPFTATSINVIYIGILERITSRMILRRPYMNAIKLHSNFWETRKRMILAKILASIWKIKMLLSLRDGNNMLKNILETYIFSFIYFIWHY